MSILITANGEDITKQIRHTLNIQQNINEKVDVASFIYRKFGSRTYVPETGHVINISENGNIIFSGTIIEFQDATDKEDVVLYKITAKDWTHFLDRRLVAQSYKNKTASEIVVELVAQFAPDITTNNVEATAVNIPTSVFDYQRPSDVIGDLAKYSGCDWWIDYNKDLHFKSRGSNQAPFNLKETIGGVEQTHIKNSLVLKKSDKQIKNVIFVVGNDHEQNEVDEQVAKGDGTQLIFDTIYKFSEKPVVKVNGVVKTVGVAYLDDPLLFDCVWSFSEKNITFQTAPASGQSITLIGKPLVPLFVKLTAEDISKGVYEFKITDKTLKTYEAVRDRAKAEIEEYANSIGSASFSTYRSGLKAGQKILVSSEIRGIENEEYIIQQVITKMHDHSRFVYQVKLANVKDYDIITFLREQLRTNDRAISFGSDVGQQLMKIIMNNEKIAVGETYLLNGNKISPIETIALDETLDLKIDFTITPVWGPYEMTSIDDPKRVPLWDGGATW